MKAIIFINGVKSKCVSQYGNPSAYISGTYENGNSFEGYTATDAMCGWGAEDHKNKKVEIEYHTTRKGNNIIDYINEPKK